MSYFGAGILPMIGAWGQQGPAQYAPFNPVAGFTPMQQQGWDRSIAGANAFAGAGNDIMGLFNQQMPQATAQQVGEGPQVAAQQFGYGPDVAGQMIGAGPQVQGFNTNAMMIGDGPQVSGEKYMVSPGQNIYANQVGSAPQVGLEGMNFFDNPYMQQSINNTLAANSKSFMENTLPQLDQGAIGVGQAGSTRHALAQGSALTNLNQQNLDMAGAMNTAMYESGKNSYLNQRAQDLGAQTTNAGNWLQSQLANQGANLQAAGMNQQDDLARALANQGVGMQGQLANQNQWLQTQLANQGADLSSQQGNQAIDMQGQLANQNQWLQSQLANQGIDMQGQLANQSNRFNTNQLNQAGDLQSQLANQNLWGQTQFNNQNADLQAQLGNQAGYLSKLGMGQGLLGAYGQSQMAAGDIMGQIGAQQQGMNQSQINAGIDRWNFDQNAIGNKLGQLTGLFGGSGAGGYGQSQSSGSSGKF